MKGNKSVKPKKPDTKPGDKPGASLLQYVYCLPCVIFIAVVILVLRAHLHKNISFGNHWSFSDDRLWDLAAWWKSRIVVFSSALALGVLLWRVFAKSIVIKKTIIYIPMAVYTVAVILSFAFSQYKEMAWSGNNERFEGTYVHVCYMFMLFYTINTIDNKKILKILFCAVIISQILLQILGIFQFIERDPIQTVIGQKLVFPNQVIDKASGYTIWQEIDKLARETPPRSLLHNPGRRVNQTVYSFNYTSFYLSAVIPVFVMLFLFSLGVKQKIFMGVMVALLFFNICAANASGGFLGLFFAFVAALVTFRKHLIKWRYRLLIIIVLAGASVLATNRYMKNTEKSAILEQVKGQVVEAVSTREVNEKIDYFINNKDSIVVSLDNNEMKINVSKDAEYVIENISDDQGALLELQVNGRIISAEGNNYNALAVTFEDERFANLEILIPEQAGIFENKKICIIKLKNHEKVWPFQVKQEGTFYMTDAGASVKLRKVPHFGFKNREDFGTGRGFIWSRTFPLMAETPLIGRGADTFVMVYPQDDFTGLHNYGWRSGTIIDKPHNFILLNFVDTGGLSALALIAIIFIYIFQSYKIYSKNIQYDIYSKLGAGIYLGMIAFFFSGMVYDTSVNVMPLIYGLLGIGIACNREAAAEAAGEEGGGG